MRVGLASVEGSLAAGLPLVWDGRDAVCVGRVVLADRALGRARLRTRAGLKRAGDVCGAAVLLAALALPMAGVALAVRATSRGPALFRQARTGRRGRTFRMWKFRTMRTLDCGETAGHTLAGDPRITWLGRYLRCASIDELPQLFNVLAGEMSLVGPRPHAIGQDRHYAQVLPSYAARAAVRPGMTGLAQVRGLRGPVATPSAMQARLDADLAYIARWSLAGDALILARTLATGLAAKNAG